MKPILNLYFTGMLFLAGMPLAHAITQQETLNNVANSVAKAAQAAYTKMVEKLEQDGGGASATSDSQKGYIPTQGSFMRRVAFETITKSKHLANNLFVMQYRPGGEKIFTIKLNKDSLSKEEENLAIAKILDSFIGPMRTTYTKMVLSKVKKDGAGASLDYLDKPGFIPLPAVFARQVAADAAFRISSILQRDISIGLRSEWNLNRQQSLKDDFEREGWHFLIGQQEDRLAAKKALRTLKWEPFFKLENLQNKQQLRYLGADIATGKACVSCHNNLEKGEKVKRMRGENNVAAGKVFELNELMGALSIAVQMDNK